MYILLISYHKHIQCMNEILTLKNPALMLSRVHIMSIQVRVRQKKNQKYYPEIMSIIS